MNKKKLYVYLLIVVVSIFITLPFISKYLSKVNYYQPIQIKVDSKSSFSSNDFYPFGISPNGRIFRFFTNDSITFFQGYSFLNKIAILVDDSVFSKFNNIQICIGKSNCYYTPDSIKKTWENIGSKNIINKNLKVLVAPISLNNTDSKIRMIFSVIHWSIIQKTFLVIFILLIFLLLSYLICINRILIGIFVKKLYKIITIFALIIVSFLIKFINKLLFIISSLFFKTKSIIASKNIINKLLNIIRVLLVLLFEILLIYIGFKLVCKYFNDSILSSLYLSYDWKNVLIFILISIIIVVLSSELFYKLIRMPKNLRQNIRLLFFTILFMLVAGEIGLRFLDKYKLANELSGSKRYQSVYAKVECIGNLKIYSPNLITSSKNKEFTISIKTNNEGLCDNNFTINKPKDEIRIAAIGDSYTQGIGTTYDSTWVNQLKQLLQNKNPEKKINLLNAGVGGSDPFFYYMLLKYRMLKYKPDIVIITFNQSDIDDLEVRGGFERFLPDGTTQYKNGPSWEWLYAESYIFRMIIFDVLHYNRLLKPNLSTEETIKLTIAKYKPCFFKIKELCDSNNIKLLTVFHPQYFDITSGQFLLEPIYDWYLNNISNQCLNLFDYFIEKENMNTKNVFNYYWKIDRHHNGRGYATFARGVEWKLNQMGIIKTSDKIKSIE